MTARPSLSELVAIRERLDATRAAHGLVHVHCAGTEPELVDRVNTFIAHAPRDMAKLIAEAATLLAENVRLTEKCTELRRQLDDARAAAESGHRALLNQAIAVAHAQKRPAC